MDYKFLFTNGDSWTWGQGLQEDQPDGKPRGQWPDVLGKKMKSEVINLAECGSSNERICRTTIQWICDNQEKIKDTFFIIGWTISDRWEWWDNFEQDWIKCYAHHGGDTLTYRMPKKWWTKFYTRFFDINNGIYKSTLQMVILQTFLKYNKCKYLFFQGFGSHHFSTSISNDLFYVEGPSDVDVYLPYESHQSLFKQLDFGNIMVSEWYDSMDNFLRYKFGHDGYNDAMEKVHGHPNRESHRLWALEIWKFLLD
jgi:hypothetical protein|tara:strand:- start:5963 stop:6724 length:762 start_codon:yes stop_codon:yes gene_type:complete